MSHWLPPSVTSITVEVKNGTVIADVGTVGHIHSERLVSELGDKSNAGFAMAMQFDNATAEFAPSDGTRWSDPDLPEAFECKSGAVGQFTWSD